MVWTTVTLSSKTTSSIDPIVLGRVGAPFGVKGWVHIQSFASEPESLLQYKTWYLWLGRSWKEFEVLEAKKHGKGFVALLREISNSNSNSKSILNSGSASSSNSSSSSPSTSRGISSSPREKLYTPSSQSSDFYSNQDISMDMPSPLPTREEARLMTNAEIGIDRSLLPEIPEENHYWIDLIGLRVVNELGIELGYVDSLFETGANDVLVVKDRSNNNIISNSNSNSNSNSSSSSSSKNNGNSKNNSTQHTQHKGSSIKNKEYLIPYVPKEYILEVDLKKREMKVHWDPDF